MGLLGPKLQVLQRGNGHQFVGVSNAKNEIVITYSDNITVYDTAVRKVTRSWAVGPGQSLTTPAIHNAAENEFVVVINSNIIKTFTEDFDKGDKFTVSSLVHCITSRKEPLVVFKNGFVASLSEVLCAPEKTWEGPISSSTRIVRFIEAGQHYFIVYDDEVHYLVLAGFPKVKLSFGTSNLVSVCYLAQDEGFLLFTFWSDGSLCLSTITKMSFLGRSIDMRKLSSVAVPQVDLGHTALLGDGLVAVTAGNNQIHILDLKYGITHERLQVGGVRHLVALGTHLVVVDGESVTIYKFSSPSVLLSTVVGKDQSYDLSLPQCGSWCDSMEQKSSKSTDDVTHMEVLLNSQNQSKLESAWIALWSAKSPSERHAVASSPFMMKFLQKLTNSKDSWFELLMSKIVSDNTISARMYNGLIEGIVYRKKWKLLANCLTILKDISEDEMFKCLESVLPSEFEKMTSHAREIISIAVTLPITEDKLVEVLRRLSLDRAMVLLLHLKTILKVSELGSASDVDKALVWICALLDAHFTQIIVTSSAWKILLEVREVVSTLVELYDNLSEIEAALSKMREATKGSKDRNRFSYKIEVMSL